MRTKIQFTNLGTEPEPDQQEPEPEQQSKLLPNRGPCDLYHADGTPDNEKASACMGAINARLKKTINDEN